MKFWYSLDSLIAQFPRLSLCHKIKVESYKNKINLEVIYIKSKLQTDIFIVNYKESVPIVEAINNPLENNWFLNKMEYMCVLCRLKTLEITNKIWKWVQFNVSLCILENLRARHKPLMLHRMLRAQCQSSWISQIMTWFKLNKVKTHEILKDLHETSNLVISLIHLLPYGSSLNNNQKETIYHV